MKDKLMEIQFEHGTIKVWHKSLVGRLNDVFDLGNHYRMLEGKEPKRLDHWLANKDTIEMLEEFNYRMDNYDYITGEPIHIKVPENKEETIKGDISPIMQVVDYKEESITPRISGNTEVVDSKEENKITIKKAITAKRGKNGGTYAHLHIMIQAAKWLSKGFEFDITRKFIVDNIFNLRDQGGESFKEVITLLDKAFPNQDNKGKFIRYCKYVRQVCELPKEVSWDKASTEKLDLRTKELNRVKILLESGLVTDFKQVIK